MRLWKKLFGGANQRSPSIPPHTGSGAAANASAMCLQPRVTPVTRFRSPEALDEALLDAADCGDANGVRALLAEGADVGNEGALIMAAQNGHHEVIRLLLDRGANPDVSSYNGVTALSQAAMNGHLRVVELLLARHARVDTKLADGTTPLLLASQNGHLAVVEALLDRGADVTVRTGGGDTPLIQASYRGNREIVRALLLKGADVNAGREDGVTSLHLAAKGGHCEIVLALLDHGADVSSRMKNGATALMLAAVEGHREAATALLANGADPRIKLGNVTAQMMAAHEGYHELAQLLEPSPRSPEENLRRWKSSGEPEAWISQRSDGWRHDDWLQLLATLRSSDYWPMEEAGVGQHLEALWDRLKLPSAANIK
jgi:ankyrin repeat protein